MSKINLWLFENQEGLNFGDVIINLLQGQYVFIKRTQNFKKFR